MLCTSREGAAMQQRKTDESPRTFHELNFGTHLKVLRDRHGIKQSEVVAKLPTTWTQPMYSDIERGRTSPSFDDLEYIYQALHRAGVQLTLQDRKQFLTLAQAKLDAKRTHRVQKSTEAWSELRRRLVRIDHLPDNDEVFPLTRESMKRHVPTTNTVRREIDHLLGRETWLDSLVGTIKDGPLKVLVVQGPPGSGKTSEIHRIANRFLQSIPRYYIVLSTAGQKFVAPSARYSQAQSLPGYALPGGIALPAKRAASLCSRCSTV